MYGVNSYIKYEGVFLIKIRSYLKLFVKYIF